MELQREVLLAAIKQVLPAMARRETFEQSDKLAFTQGKIAAFDDHVLITHPLPGDLALEGAVDGKRLADLLGKLTAELVDLNADNNQLILRAGRSRTRFDVLEARLPIDSVDMTGELVDLPAGFRDQLRWASAGCARELSRPALNCVLVEGGWLQASDGYRASRVRHGEAALPRLLLPLAQVEVLVDYELEQVALSEGGEWCRFATADGTVLACRSMAGMFPDLAAHYEVEGQAITLTATLAEALDRARIFARREHAVDEEVRLTMRPNQVVVAASCDGAEFSEVVRCEGAADGVAFTIHPEYLAKALESGTKCVIGSNRVLFSGEDWDHIVALKSG